jgi:hypothetical protein
MVSIFRKTAIAAAFALATTTAYADISNTRPYTPATGGLSTLQGLFTGIGSSISALNDQDDAAIFEPTGFGVSAASYVAELWGTNISDYTLGLYEYGDTSNTVTMFDSASQNVGSRVGITFFTNGNVEIRNADNGTLIDSATGFGTRFGLWFDTNPWPSGGLFYSEDSLNGGNAQALIYEGKGDTVTVPTLGGPITLNDTAHWYAAWEGLVNNASCAQTSGVCDFDDALVMFESITPVPEPETYAMLLAGLGLMGFVARRRKLKATA